MKHILIVDDNVTNRLAAQNAISQLYTTTMLSSGREVLERLEDIKPDLILLDINMPDMDGLEVMKRIREQEEWRNTPIIVLTAEDDAMTESLCLEQGAFDYITKPFVPIVMRSRIGRALELEELRKRLTNRLDETIREVSDMKSRAMKDALTGLWNRAYTEAKVNEILEEGGTGTLFMMDLDNFKIINDRYGHIAGDYVLQCFGEIIEEYGRDGDVLCRIGGDEFMIFIQGKQDKKTLELRASNLISRMCSVFEHEQYETNSAVSVGIAQHPADGKDFASLYNAADKALYHVKQNGKNAYHFYSDRDAAERERSGKAMDLNYLKEIMRRSDSANGVYRLDYDNFKHVFNFVRRMVERGDKDVQIVLFTLQSDNGRMETDRQEYAMSTLENAVFHSLRKVDISARYSSKQLLVVLLGSDEKNGNLVAKRILDCFKTQYLGELYFEYDLVTM